MIFLDGKQKTVVHKIEPSHELNILFDLFLYLSNVFRVELDHINLILLVPFLNLLKVDVLEGAGVLEALGLDHLSVDH